MNLKLEKPVVFFDLETTGINVTNDKIVEIAILKISPDGSEESFTQRYNPGIDIPVETSEIHGITNAMVKDSPSFEEGADKIISFIGDADLAGYNSNRFDIPMLLEELLKIGKEFDMTTRKSIDVQTIFFKKEQRTLSAAYKFYCGEELVNAHSAVADVKATYEVLKSQLDKYDDLENDAEFLAEFTVQGGAKIGDFAGRLVKDKEDRLLINFGKYKGQVVEDVLLKDPSYYNWMMRGEFPLYTKHLMTIEMNKVKTSGKLSQKPNPPKAKSVHAKKAVPKKVVKKKTEDLGAQLDMLKQKFNS
jgi:DNA polymerase-3 subunit epsilon